MSTAAPKAQAAQRFRLEKSTSGHITALTLHGVLDEGFEGKKLADSIRTTKVVLNLRDVRRFASWGMAEWMNFLRAHPDTDLYLVECSTYSVSQFNLVTGLLGHAKVVSFYAPYRCGTCEHEFEQLILVPLDREAVRELNESEQPCPKCGAAARMDRYPGTASAAIIDRPAFDLDDEVLAYLRSKLKYNLVPDLTRFRAYRQVHKDKDVTYLRVSGAVSRLPGEVVANASEGTTIVDLAGIVFSSTELGAWRTYVDAALPKVGSLELLDCPPGFLEGAVTSDDLRGKVKVRTFGLAYHCPSCNTTTVGVVDVAANLEQLTEGTIPSARCPGCKAVLVASTSPEEALLLRQLPAREHDAAIDAFLTKARAEPIDKLEDCLTLRPKPAKQEAPASRAPVVTAVLSSILVAGIALVAFILWNQKHEAKPASSAPAAAAATAAPQQPTYQRPDWITADQPSSAFCHDMINRLMCVGVSPFMADRNAAVAEANDAALEELANTVGLKITDSYFKDDVLAGYNAARTKALGALQAADVDRKSSAYAQAADAVAKARHRVVEIFQASGGPAVPAQRSDWYWEQYAAAEKGKTEFLVFVRYDIALDAVRALASRYTDTVSAGSTTARTAFPSLAWEYPDFTGGAVLTKVGGPLAAAHIDAHAIVMALGDHQVADAASFAKALEDWMHTGSGALKVTVKSGDAAAQQLELKK